MSSKPLSDLSVPQIDLILAKLHLKAPSRYNGDERLELLQCSAIYSRYLSEYKNGDISAHFDKSGKFIDFSTNDKCVSGIFCFNEHTKGKQYPCTVCSDEVTNKNDDTGNGRLLCNGCDHYFHNSCNNKKVSPALFEALKDSPEYVKVYCPHCCFSINSVETNLKKVEDGVNTVIDKVDNINKKLDDSKFLYSQMASKPTSTINNTVTDKLVKQLHNQQKTLKVEETAERNKRTILVRRPMDNTITSSGNIRKQFNKQYPDVIIRNCRITAGGSFKIELDKEEEVVKVSQTWKDNLFGGNDGIVSPEDLHTGGIIKHVYEDYPQDEIEEEIKNNYPVSKVEFFKRNGEFTGTIKLIFNDRKSLVDALTGRVICIHSNRHLLEEYKPSPRVIKCNRCQAFGHIARRCRSTKPKCGKCGEDSHESEGCNSSVRKCAHCNEQHETGNRNCKVMKQKLEEIINRAQYGF